ncbi:hypothetical protein [Herbaspirillum rubrisubalbicans]|uniref:Uncharacterized protein n=1 Tax=Herbaspirillum rubrisubalbicans TaxID=80842 RepID=A0AAD0XG00_9BURK|nr:hypothetical protein [Herbaspirillum rubrisubalbicans]AYR23015.1 hypothetical protein RC54_03915 [Herbaspirillum rubrisubalbicans]
MATKSNVTKVQVPGEASAPTPAEAGDQAADMAGNDSAAGAGDGAGDPLTLDAGGTEGATVVNVDALREENEELQARLDAQADELAALKAQLANTPAQPLQKAEPLRAGGAGRNDFKHLRADQVDVGTLKRPVQTKDGWLVPPKIFNEKA